MSMTLEQQRTLALVDARTKHMAISPEDEARINAQFPVATDGSGTVEEAPVSGPTADWAVGRFFRRGAKPNAIVGSDRIEVVKVSEDRETVFANFDREGDGQLIYMPFATRQITLIPHGE